MGGSESANCYRSFNGDIPVDSNISSIKRRSLRATREREKIARQLRNIDFSKLSSPVAQLPGLERVSRSIVPEEYILTTINSPGGVSGEPGSCC